MGHSLDVSTLGFSSTHNNTLEDLRRTIESTPPKAGPSGTIKKDLTIRKIRTI
jgi:hypothetical protein